MAEPMHKQWYPCQFCGEPLTFISQYQRWYCYRCQRYAEERKSYYPEVYRKPEQEHRLRFGALPKILFKPKEAFAEIYHNTGILQGITVAIIIYVISSLISYSAGALSGYYYSCGGFGGYYSGQFTASTLTGLTINLAIGIPLSIVSLLAIGWLTAKLAKAIGKGRGDVGKTIGFFGYATVVSLVMGVVSVILFMVIMREMIMQSSAGPMDKGGFPATLLPFAIIAVVIAIIGFVWSLWINGTATSVANDVSVGIGVVSYFLAAIIVGIIVTVIVAAALFVWISTLF
ncbi:MAG: YIP1 family protein [Candidatus Thermoplasmatota archaeon]|nr:YIP1 family protein [Candidatus Thermoplasmatota archaeon]